MKVLVSLEADRLNEIQLSSTQEAFSMDKKEHKSFIEDDSPKQFSENTLRNVALLLKTPYFEKDRK